MLTEFTYAHCFYICIAWSVSSWLLSDSVDPLWSDSFFAPTSTLSLSSLPSLACDEIVQLQKLFGIWADDLELVRNLASLAAAPYCLNTVSIYKNSNHIYAFLGHLSSPLLSVWEAATVFMMSLCSKFWIKWWLTCSEASTFTLFVIAFLVLTQLDSNGLPSQPLEARRAFKRAFEF
jgi:hypothetical protein